MLEDDVSAAQLFIDRALKLIDSGKKEQVIRDNLTASLRSIFPSKEWWVEEHISVCEDKLHYSTAARSKTGFVDNLVGYTAIEYESDLNKPAKHKTGYHQIQEYCAGLLQAGLNRDLILGVLSDTISWEVYAVEDFKWSAGAAGKHAVDADEVKLKKVAELRIADASVNSARNLITFLRTYIGRQGSRRLSAKNIASDLGIGSPFYRAAYEPLLVAIKGQLAARPEYQEVLRTLWNRFVGFVSESKNPVEFDEASYASEVYVLTLAKLVVANVLSKKTLISDDDELQSILSGDYFERLQVSNLVEYDYFGWLTQGSAVADLIPTARLVQENIAAYDFRSPPAEDLFGELLIQLPAARQRILLGQQWTPAWLATKIARWVLEHVPHGAEPCLLDMCCGSGTILVAAINERKAALSPGTPAQARYETLRNTITGFDIDPLAVMLAKASWLLAVRDAIEPISDVDRIVIPVYNADSLMRITGVSESIDEGLAKGSVNLEFADQRLELPAFLLDPKYSVQFDRLLDLCYPFATTMAHSGHHVSQDDIDSFMAESELTTDDGVTAKEAARTEGFARDFVAAVRKLEGEKRNGIWGFVLKNSYRPALLAGKFNGLVSNPPWMALSRLADNPYGEFLRKKAKEFAVFPAGSSAPHAELATVFLLHAVERFLSKGAAYACIVPETVLNGGHQDNFRRGKFITSKERHVPMSVDEVWRVHERAFDTNKAVVLCGHRTPGAEAPRDVISGLRTSQSHDETVVFRVVKATGHFVWTEADSRFVPNGVADSRFQQGADVFPRRVWFHERQAGAKGTWRLSRIESGSDLFYLVSDEKKKEVEHFSVPKADVNTRYFQDVLLSKHLAPFHAGEPGKALLPLKRDRSGEWVALKVSEIARDPSFSKVMMACLKAFEKAQDLDATANDVLTYVASRREKLGPQKFTKGERLVVYGAGGSELCAAFVTVGSDNLIVDQTLYWARIASSDEAYYLLGMLNSRQVNEAIAPFQASGLKTERHIHKLPFLFVPRYDAKDPKHQAVASATQALQTEFDSKRSDIQDQLQSKRGLAQRRTKVRDFVEGLGSFAKYTSACEDVLKRKKPVHTG